LRGVFSDRVQFRFKVRLCGGGSSLRPQLEGCQINKFEVPAKAIRKARQQRGELGQGRGGKRDRIVFRRKGRKVCRAVRAFGRGEGGLTGSGGGKAGAGVQSSQKNLKVASVPCFCFNCPSIIGWDKTATLRANFRARLEWIRKKKKEMGVKGGR